MLNKIHQSELISDSLRTASVLLQINFKFTIYNFKIHLVLEAYRSIQISLSDQIDCKNTVFLQDIIINMLFEINSEVGNY